MDPLSFGVLQWISCVLVNLRLNSIGFTVFLHAGNQIWTFYSRKKYSCFGGSFHKVTVGPWFWHVKAATAIYSAQDVREVNNVVESLDAKDVNTPTPCKMLEK